MEVHIRDVAALLGGTIEGPEDGSLTGFAGIEDATSGQLSFLANPQYVPHLYSTGASAVLVANNFQPAEELPSGTALIRVNDPYAAMAKLMQAFAGPESPEQRPTEIHPSAVVHPDARLGEGVHIGPLCVIEAGAIIGAHSTLAGQNSIGRDAVIGEHCLLAAQAIVQWGCSIGDRCILQPGCIIGSEGFGFAPTDEGYEKVPQVGNVVVGNLSEIGAGTTIDRATLGSTKLGEGVKLDNLIQIAHNVVIGDHTVMAAQTGVAGSTTIGSGCMIGGQVGINGHIQIADRTRIAAKSGITASVIDADQVLQGNPAQPIKRHQKAQIAIRKLIREFEKRNA